MGFEDEDDDEDEDERRPLTDGGGPIASGFAHRRFSTPTSAAMHSLCSRFAALSWFALCLPVAAHCEFRDDFDGRAIDMGWGYFPGDGTAEMTFKQMDGFARIEVDATRDRDTVWWALIKRDVSKYLDMAKLTEPDYELRVEARVRLSDAPKRVNFMINTQRTTDFHEQLREYDISDAGEWRVISMTTSDLDAMPGDQLNVQLAVTDWGPGTYFVDLDYYRAEIVNVKTAGPDKGEPLVYHPPVADVASFAQHLAVAQDALINARYPEVNFGNWHVETARGEARVLTVGAGQWPILRWDFSAFKGQQANGPGLLELTTQSVALGGDYIGALGRDLGEELGKIRVVEIFRGDPAWDQRSVTFDSFTQGKELADVVNSQMIFDTELAPQDGGKTYVTISRPVMQRLLDGETRGIILSPLGAIVASIYDSEDADPSHAPTLHFSAR